MTVPNGSSSNTVKNHRAKHSHVTSELASCHSISVKKHILSEGITKTRSTQVKMGKFSVNQNRNVANFTTPQDMLRRISGLLVAARQLAMNVLVCAIIEPSIYSCGGVVEKIKTEYVKHKLHVYDFVSRYWCSEFQAMRVSFLLKMGELLQSAHPYPAWLSILSAGTGKYRVFKKNRQFSNAAVSYLPMMV